MASFEREEAGVRPAPSRLLRRAGAAGASSEGRGDGLEEVRQPPAAPPGGRGREREREAHDVQPAGRSLAGDDGAAAGAGAGAGAGASSRRRGRRRQRSDNRSRSWLPGARSASWRWAARWTRSSCASSSACGTSMTRTRAAKSHGLVRRGARRDWLVSSQIGRVKHSTRQASVGITTIRKRRKRDGSSRLQAPRSTPSSRAVQDRWCKRHIQPKGAHVHGGNAKSRRGA